MKAKLPKPQWTVYEQQVFDLLESHFLGAKVRQNVRLKGRFSKRQRQIDILVTEQTPAGILKTVVDTKFFERKVDVKAVEAFAGFVSDVGGQRGMLITSKGFTRAALRRAFYDPSDLELDILNFSALHRFQAFGAIPYAGEHAFMVPAPLGWIIDADRRKGCIATLYQRGLDWETAVKKKEFLYINFWDRSRDKLTAAELDERQVASMRLSGPVTVSHRAIFRRSDAITRLRIAEVERYKCLEVTGFLEFDDVIFFAVLLTPRETQVSNIRRLESILRRARPIKLKRDNTLLIANIQERLKESLPASERAKLLRNLGYWYRDMQQFQDARQPLEDALSLDPESRYHTIKQLLPVLVNLDEKARGKELMALLLRLDPHNPTVFTDCFTFGIGWIERDDLLNLIDSLKVEMPDDQLVRANCDFYAGALLMCHNLASAKERLVSARQAFRHVFPGKHHVFRALRIALRDCS